MVYLDFVARKRQEGQKSAPIFILFGDQDGRLRVARFDEFLRNLNEILIKFSQVNFQRAGHPLRSGE